MATRTGPRILIIRLSAIGDVVITTPISRALREAIPDAHLAWVVEPRASDILAANSYLDEIIIWNRPKGALSFKDMLEVRRLLRPGRWDWAIDCQGLLRSALVARLSGAARIVGNSSAKESADLLYHVRVPRNPLDQSSRQRCLDLLGPLGVLTTDRRMVVRVRDEERGEGREVLRRAGLGGGTRYACLVPNTTWEQKHWFEDRWAALADLLQDELGLTPVLMGAAGDRASVERIRGQAAAECVNTAGETSLRTASAILEGADLAVAVDTGLMHVAVAVGTPTVGLSGASGWPGFADYENFALVREPMSCSPCFHNPTCGGRFDCMQALTPRRILAAAEALVGGQVPLAL
jgi:heptosyltransferase I